MSGFAPIAGSKPLTPGLYKVIVPLYFPEEALSVKGGTASNTAWQAYIAIQERAASQLRIRFPRTSNLDPKTGLDKAGGTYFQRKGLESGKFWMLIAVTGTNASTVAGLYNAVARFVPGMRTQFWSLISWREKAAGAIQYQKYVVTAPVVTPKPTTPAKPVPTPALPKPAPTVILPKPAPAPNPTTPATPVAGTAPKPTTPAPVTPKPITAPTAPTPEVAVKSNAVAGGVAVVGGLAAGLAMLALGVF